MGKSDELCPVLRSGFIVPEKSLRITSASELGETLSSVLARTIRRDIILGRLAPGQQLKLKDMVELYGFGAMPIREALSRLTTSGLVQSKGKRGFFVKEVSVAELRDLYRVGLLIELQALREAIEQGDLAWEANILSAHHKLSKLQIYSEADGHALNDEWEAAHEEFHRQLISACMSPWLLEFSQTIREQANRYRHITVASRKTSSRDVSGEHQAILDACLARDVEGAVALLGQHMQTTMEIALTQPALWGQK